MATETPEERQRSGTSSHPAYERTLAFGFGVAFVVALLGLAVFIPEPSVFQWRVFRAVLALAAAGAATFIPGVLRVTLTPWVRASGAIAVFAAVYGLEPARLVVQDPFGPVDPSTVAPKELASRAADDWLRLVDGGEYGAAFDAADGALSDHLARQDFVQLVERVRRPLGAVEKREKVGEYPLEVRVGARAHTVTYLYFTKFAARPAAIKESLTLVSREGTKTWGVATHLIDVAPEPAP
jgi:hypothetical protein